MRLQGTNWKVSENSRTRDCALEAAHAGIALALKDMQGTSWGNVGSNWTRTTNSDTEGTSQVTVEYLSYTPKSDEGIPEDQGLRVLIRATGKWTSAANALRTVTRKVEGVVRMTPRSPTRGLATEDYAAAEDFKANPSTYDVAQGYAAFAWDRNSNDYSTVTIEPGNRIEGRVYIRDYLETFQYSNMTTDARLDLLSAIGNRWATGTPHQVYHAHPFGRELNPSGGDITYVGAVSLPNDMTRLKTTTALSGVLGIPSLVAGNYATYRVFEGGPLYESVVISSSLSNVTLRPTASNPLGIFRTTGSLTLNSNVTIQGTLLVAGSLTVSGREVAISSLNWSGSQLLDESYLWSRLPAVLAGGDVEFEDSARIMIDGGMFAFGDLIREAANYEFRDYSTLNLSGTATAVPVQQPWSEVQLNGISDLSEVSSTGYSSIWLEQGNGGRWYPIVGIDVSRGKLTVVGEVNLSSPVNCRIRPNRNRYVDIQGPVAAAHFILEGAPSWQVSSLWWSTLRSNWQTANNVTPINFTTWLETPLNVHLLGVFYPYSYSQYGMTLEPTFQIRKGSGTFYRWSPTLFEQYSDSGAGAAHSGYRWQLVSWREI